MLADLTLAQLLGLWLVAAACIVLSRWLRPSAGAGLVLAYIFGMWLIHWAGAAPFAVPGFVNQNPNWLIDSPELQNQLDEIDRLQAQIVHAGTEQATNAALGFAAGSILLGLPLGAYVQRLRKRTAPVIPPAAWSTSIASSYVKVGVAAFLGIALLDRRGFRIPALLPPIWNLLLVGLCLGCWITYHRGQAGRFLRWFAGGFLSPVATILAIGFASYGIAMLMTMLSFVATMVRPRWLVALCGAALLYLGATAYVTYMRDRNDIRDAVWYFKSPTMAAVQFVETAMTPLWFDPSDNDQLTIVHARLNQNYLVGSAVLIMEPESKSDNSQSAEFLHGETLRIAFAALVPRQIWPSKPSIAGSGDLVTTYTGIPFLENVSVGVGHVLELYINWGPDGVFWGMVVIGAGLSLLDALAAQRLRDGDWKGFMLWFLPGIACLQVSGAFAEMVPSAAASAIVAVLANAYIGAKSPAGAPGGDTPLGAEQALPLRAPRAERGVLAPGGLGD